MSQPVSDLLESLTDLERRCKQLGVPVTVQRRAVFAALAARDDHPTADEIFADLATRIPGISKATAYRALDTLVTLGLVVRVSHPGAVARYDAKTYRHHHVICEVCGAMADVESKALDALRLPDLTRSGFVARDFSVHVRGVCGACVRATSKRRTATTRSKPPANATRRVTPNHGTDRSRRKR